MDDKDLPTITLDDMSLDLGYGAVPPSQYTLSGITGGGGIDTITIDPSWSSSSHTISSTLSSGAYSTSYNWAPNNPTTVTINSDGIDMAAGTDIKVDGKSLKEFMSKMEQRLSILVPDPAKLEKFQALKQAYEHYKTMESLCFDEPEEEK
jgi:hypothetical protein